MLRTSTIGIALLWLLVLLPTCSCDTEPDEARHWFEFQPATTKAEVAVDEEVGDAAAPPAVGDAAAPPAVGDAAAPPAVGDAAAPPAVAEAAPPAVGDAAAPPAVAEAAPPAVGDAAAPPAVAEAAPPAVGDAAAPPAVAEAAPPAVGDAAAPPAVAEAAPPAVGDAAAPPAVGDAAPPAVAEAAPPAVAEAAPPAVGDAAAPPAVAEAAPPAVGDAAPPAVAEAEPPAVGDAAAVSPVTTTTSSLLNDTDKNDETKPEGDSKDTDVIEPDSQVDLDVEPTEAPALTTTPKVQLSQTKEPYCETLSNGTELCDERCEGGQLKCLNGGVCVVDDDRVETCRCPEDSDFTGPHCENRARIPIYSPSASCDGRLFLIILVTACIIIAVLIIINIITVIHLRRERPRGRKERDLQFSVRCPDSNQGSEGEMRARSNNLYFEAAGFNSCSSVDETSTIRSEDTESTTTYSAPVHENIYAVVNDGFRLQRPSLLLNNSTTTRA